MLIANQHRHHPDGEQDHWDQAHSAMLAGNGIELDASFPSTGPTVVPGQHSIFHNFAQEKEDRFTSKNIDGFCAYVHSQILRHP